MRTLNANVCIDRIRIELTPNCQKHLNECCKNWNCHCVAGIDFWCASIHAEIMFTSSSSHRRCGTIPRNIQCRRTIRCANKYASFVLRWMTCNSILHYCLAPPRINTTQPTTKILPTKKEMCLFVAQHLGSSTIIVTHIGLGSQSLNICMRCTEAVVMTFLNSPKYIMYVCCAHNMPLAPKPPAKIPTQDRQRSARYLWHELCWHFSCLPQADVFFI